jgi:hypothetical protein
MYIKSTMPDNKIDASGNAFSQSNTNSARHVYITFICYKQNNNLVDKHVFDALSL